jgi:hypothetical protein
MNNRNTLDDVLDAAGLAAGDFVRNCKQLLDLLGRRGIRTQIESLAGYDVRDMGRPA